MKNKRYQEGYWISLGIGFGMMFGLLIGIPFENSPIGLLIGLLIGTIFGYSLEKKFNKNPIKLTKKQIKLKKIMAIVAFFIALLISLFLVAKFF